MKDRECVITFPNITYAMKFEKKISEININTKIIPVPRSVSSSCGVCGKFDCMYKTEIEKLCNDNHVKFDGIYSIYDNNK